MCVYVFARASKQHQGSHGLCRVLRAFGSTRPSRLTDPSAGKAKDWEGPRQPVGAGFRGSNLCLRCVQLLEARRGG
eukprot:5024013-Alexandrium_andersonii.AAC.1